MKQDLLSKLRTMRDELPGASLAETRRILRRLMDAMIEEIEEIEASDRKTPAEKVADEYGYQPVGRGA